jgi:hypothetical protein
MSRHIQVTFDAHDPGVLSSFWRDVLGYVHPGPPGVELPEGTDPLAAWDDFLARAGVPEDQRNTRSTSGRLPGCRGTSGWPPWRPNAPGSSPSARPGCIASSPSPR